MFFIVFQPTVVVGSVAVNEAPGSCPGPVIWASVSSSLQKVLPSSSDALSRALSGHQATLLELRRVSSFLVSYINKCVVFF